MVAWTGVDLIAASALATALFGALLLMALLSRAREDVLGSPLGWRLVATAMSLFALRGFLRFSPWEMAAWLTHAAGILAATLLPAGLFLVLRASQTTEVSEPAS